MVNFQIQAALALATGISPQPRGVEVWEDDDISFWQEINIKKTEINNLIYLTYLKKSDILKHISQLHTIAMRHIHHPVGQGHQAEAASYSNHLYAFMAALILNDKITSKIQTKPVTSQV